VTDTIPQPEQAIRLGVLTHAPADATKAFAETLLEQIGDIEVLRNRTGLIMLPMTEPAQGTSFYLGETLVAEAHVRLGHVEGYSLCLGRDLEQALAVAIIDAAAAADIARNDIETFVAEQAMQQAVDDDLLLREVEATRVEMETF
jgi:alpha-D-ribose 1-methylphosphonate 5-triphosphate synthase subunit PhnG